MDFRLRELPLGLAVAEHRLPCFSRAGFAATPLASWARTKVMCLQEQQQVLSSGLVWRYLITKWIATVKVTLSLAAKVFENSVPLCKETFLS
ncbi:uncharacterized protein [Elaeis guineensis]|uniref:Uncharacterized protein LOC114914365 isoform X2 n=1 Tax=Elaeis guineensis var. tenera TaxID=51953 RepID=A0A8N4F6L7_ELAGV|nr:uncharacterized protein LOC114914365 isoform X2 [Elaeis guineensis]